MSRVTGGRYLAEALCAHGVTHVFFVPAIGFPALVAMEDLPIRRVCAHSEAGAAYMADGYARAVRAPGVCMAQLVGSMNMAAGLRDAFLAGSPVLAFTGGPEPLTRYRNVYQEAEDFPAFEVVTKRNLRLDRVERLPDLLRLALRDATSGAPGPAHIELRGNHGQVLADEADLGPLPEEPFARVPALRPEPAADDLRRAAQALAQAERPVIVAGGGLAWSDAAAELVALSERLSIPVATSLGAKGAIREDHPLSVGVVGWYSRACANRVVAEADLVFFVGSSTGSRVTNSWRIPRRGTRVIQLDIDPTQVGRNYPAEVGLVGDAKAGLSRLLEEAGPAPPRDRWLRRVNEIVDEWRRQAAPLLASDTVPIRPERICAELTEWLPNDAVLVTDTGHAGIWTGSMVELRHPGQRYIRAAGTLGWALPAAIGVKCALPDRPVICFIGDGGFYYHMAELETAARHGIAVVVVVNDNHSFNQEKALFDAAYGGTQPRSARDLWAFREVDLASIARSLGCEAVRVERPGDLRSAFEQALRASGPAVVDVVSDIDAVGPAAWG